MSTLTHPDPEQEIGHLEGARAGMAVVGIALLGFIALAAYSIAASLFVPRRAARPVPAVAHRSGARWLLAALVLVSVICLWFTDTLSYR